MKNIALVAKAGKPEAAALASEIKARLKSQVVVGDEKLSAALGWPAPASDAEMAKAADLVVVLGGDGTLIHAARLLTGCEVPILGVNLGSLGFMTEIPRQELFTTLDDVLAGRYRIDPRIKLSCRLVRDGKVLAEDEVLNDVVLNKGVLARMTDYETSVEGQYITTYKADGVIVSTPTGSTAYALSTGGPIMHPSVDAYIIAPICSHALTQRPIVVPADRAMSLVLKSDSSDVYLTIDGQSAHPLKQGDRVEVAKSPHKVLLIKNPQMGYFAILRQKLHWGER
jgi:NAD+ kinase